MRLVIDDRPANPNGGYDLLEGDVQTLPAPFKGFTAFHKAARTPVSLLKNALFCEPYKERKH